MKSILDYKNSYKKIIDILDGETIISILVIPLNKRYLSKFDNNHEVQILKEINEEYNFNLSLPIILLSYLLGRGHLRTSMIYLFYYKELLDKKKISDTELLLEDTLDYNSVLKFVKRYEKNKKVKLKYYDVYQKYKNLCSM